MSETALYNRVETIHGIPIIDSFPAPLHRALKTEEEALNFIEHGNFKLNPLTFYRKIEDEKRKDKDEGEGRVIINTNRPVVKLDPISFEAVSTDYEFGPVFFGTGSSNPRFILCFSGPGVSLQHLATKYGRYIVRINDPRKLVDDIASFLEQQANQLRVMYMDCVQVRYDRDQLVSELPESASLEIMRMPYTQKHYRDSDDCEHRLVVELPIIGIPPSEITVELHKRLEYAEILCL